MVTSIISVMCGPAWCERSSYYQSPLFEYFLWITPNLLMSAMGVASFLNEQATRDWAISAAMYSSTTSGCSFAEIIFCGLI